MESCHDPPHPVPPDGAEVTIEPSARVGPHLCCWYAADTDWSKYFDPAEIARCAKMPTVINRTPRSARFMPGWAERSRIKITEIREERLGDITEADAVREGFADRAAFLAYFASIDDRVPVDRLRTLADLTLPVWVVSFEVVT
jgi:hypothetical protein